MSRLIAIGAMLVLVACGGGSSDPGSRTVASAARDADAPPSRSITVLGAPAGSEVFLLGTPDGNDLLGWAAAVLDSDELVDGKAELIDMPGALRALVRAPGRAITEFAWPPTGAWSLAEEARVVCRVQDTGGVFEEGALALVFHLDGRPLPLPELELVARPNGTLTLTCLPAGRFRVRVISADAERAADLELEVVTGEHLNLEVVCAPGEAVAAFWAAVDRDLATWVEGEQQ